MAQIFAVPCTSDTDAALARLRDRLVGSGLRVSGVLQHRAEQPGGGAKSMILHDAAGRFSTVISQRLGGGAAGCTLDPGALEETVQAVSDMLHDSDVLFVNRFGKQEEIGRGFAPVMGEALLAGITVVVAVAEQKRAAFDSFAGDLAQWSEPDAITLAPA